MERFTKNKKVVILLLCISLVGVIFIYNFIIKDKKINNVTSSEQVKDKTLDKKNKTEDTKENSKSSNGDEKKETSNDKTMEDKNNENSQKNTTKYSDNNSQKLISKKEPYTSKAIGENHSSNQLQPIKKGDTIKNQSKDKDKHTIEERDKKDDTIEKQSKDKHNTEEKDKKGEEINILNQKNGDYSIDIKKINNSGVKIVINSKNLNDSNEGRIMIYNDKNSLVYIDQGELESGKLNFNTQLDSGSYTGYYKVEGEKKPISFVIK